MDPSQFLIMSTVKKIIKNKYWVSAVLACIISLLVIPIVIVNYPSKIEIPNGTYIKSGSRVFYNFLNKVKATEGILVMGTSETSNSMSGNNYWGLLDRDEDIKQHFYSLAGAGRCSYVYFPLILDNPKAFENLNVLYYINPTYWRKGLNEFNEKYFERYADSGFAMSVKNKAQNLGLYEQFLKPGVNDEMVSNFKRNRIIENYRSIFYYDLNQILAEEGSSSMHKINIDSLNSENHISKLIRPIDLTYNAIPNFLKKGNSFPPIDTISNFQYEMLETFIDLTKEFKINCTFFLGPVNEIYCQGKNPELLKDHHLVVDRIKKILLNREVAYIDGSHQGTIPGTFVDVQHISEYGALLTAAQIKKYYEKNN